MDRHRPTPPRTRATRSRSRTDHSADDATVDSKTDRAAIIPILSKMLRHAADGSSAAAFAKLHLAEALVEQKPWLASIHARSVLKDNPDEARAWAVLALGQTHLGNFRYAIRSYSRALTLCPENVAYAHNLGHLLDMAEGASEDALPYLEAAYDGAKSSLDILASLLHALVRTGRTGRALLLVSETTAEGATQSKLRKLVHTLAERQSDPGLKGIARGKPEALEDGTLAAAPPLPRARQRRSAREPRLFAVLHEGLRHLPFGDYEVEAALTMAAEIMLLESASSERDLRITAAAIAWRVVRCAHLPLGAAEVAAPFRVALAAMRKRHAVLDAAFDA
jgi:Flp pilus assembly protein TadD